MAVYILSGLYAVFFAWMSGKNSPRAIRALSGRVSPCQKFSFAFFALLSFLPLFCVSAFRYGIAFDYLYTYVPGYDAVAAGRKTYFEIGFVLLNRFVQAVFQNVDWLFILTSLLFVGLVFAVVYRRSVNIPLSVFLLLGTRMYYLSFGQIRQYLVIAVFLVSLKYIEQRKPVKYAALILAASCMHTLALAYLPAYFLCRRRLSRKAYLLTGLSCFAAAPLLYTAYLFFAEKFYSNYVTNASASNPYSEAMIALTLFTFLLTVYYYRRIPPGKYDTILVNLQLIAAVVSVTTIGMVESYRLLALFMYSSVLLIPVLVRAEENRFMRALLLGTVIAVFSASALLCILKNGYLLPYKTIFTK